MKKRKSIFRHRSDSSAKALTARYGDATGFGNRSTPGGRERLAKIFRMNRRAYGGRKATRKIMREANRLERADRNYHYSKAFNRRNFL